MALGEDISKIRDDLTEIKVGIARIEERDTAQAADVSDLQTHLFGNGHCGLIKDVTVLKGRVSLLWRIIIPALIAGGGGGIWAGLF